MTTMTFEHYEGRQTTNGEVVTVHRWRVRNAQNNLIVAASSQGYSRAIDAVENAATVLNRPKLRKAYAKGKVEVGKPFPLD